MRKEIFTINFDYNFNANRRGAKYTLNGEHWLNAGEFVEIAVKSGLGLELHKDACTAFDKGDDIPEYKASVKSPKFTLTTVNLGDNKDEIIAHYFERTASETAIWGFVAGEEVITYWMTMDEFREYLNEWGYFDKHSHYVRGKALSGKMLNWLDERVTE